LAAVQWVDGGGGGGVRSPGFRSSRGLGPILCYFPNDNLVRILLRLWLVSLNEVLNCAVEGDGKTGNSTVLCDVVVCFLALQPIVVVFSQPGSGLYPPRFRGFVVTYDAPQSVGLLWTSDQSVAETST